MHLEKVVLRNNNKKKLFGRVNDSFGDHLKNFKQIFLGIPWFQSNWERLQQIDTLK